MYRKTKFCHKCLSVQKYFFFQISLFFFVFQKISLSNYIFFERKMFTTCLILLRCNKLYFLKFSNNFFLGKSQRGRFREKKTPHFNKVLRIGFSTRVTEKQFKTKHRPGVFFVLFIEGKRRYSLVFCLLAWKSMKKKLCLELNQTLRPARKKENNFFFQ